MSRCQPPYNNANIKAPRLQFAIDSGLNNDEDTFSTKEEIFEYYGLTNEEVKSWRLQQPTHKRDYNTPEMKALAEERGAGRISDEQWVDAVRANNMPKAFESVQDVPTYQEIVMAVDKSYKGIINTGGKSNKQMKKLPSGMLVASRLDIPAYKSRNKWVVTIHAPSKGKAGKVIGYAKSAHLKNVSFLDGARQLKGAMKIAAGGEKYPMATFMGKWVNTDTSEVVRLSEYAMNDSGWVQIGMNPDRGEFFYDKDGFRPVSSAEEVLQIGSLLMARDVKYMNVNNEAPLISELVVRETKDYIPQDKRASYNHTPGGEAIIISSPDGNTEIRLSQDSQGGSDFSVDNIQLDPKHLNKKMGKRLYFKSIEETLKRGGLYLSSGGMTSNMAARVWKSLEKMSKENPKLLNKELLKLGFPQLIGTFEVYSPAREEYKIDSRFEEDNVSLDEYIVIHKDRKGNVESYEQIGSEPVWHAELHHNKYRENLEKLKKDPSYFHKMYK